MLRTLKSLLTEATALKNADGHHHYHHRSRLHRRASNAIKLEKSNQREMNTYKSIMEM